MRVRTNIFQRSMLLWDRIHPYNAVHLMELPPGTSLAGLDELLAGYLEKVFPGPLRIGRGGWYLEWLESSPLKPPVKRVSLEGDPVTALSRAVEDELNTPFTGETFSPIRASLFQGGGRLFTGVTYFHPHSDAVPVVYLMEGLFRTVVSGGHDDWPPLRVASEWRTCTPGRLFSSLGDLPDQIRRVRRYARPPVRRDGGMENGLLFFTMDGEGCSRLRETARRWKVTVNDLLIGMLLKAVQTFGMKAAGHPRRKEMAVNSIVDLRKDSGRERNEIGLFLGSFSVSHELAPQRDLKETVLHINERTREIKEGRKYVGPLVGLGISSLLMKTLFSRRRENFYIKYYPHWGGITNLNLERLWGDAEVMPLNYLRAVSTGPVVPLVLSVTTLGGKSTIGLSYRLQTFSREDAEEIKGRMDEIVMAL